MSAQLIHNRKFSGFLRHPETGALYLVRFPIVNLSLCEKIDLGNEEQFPERSDDPVFDAPCIVFTMVSGEEVSWAYQTEELRAAALGRLLGADTRLGESESIESLLAGAA